MTTSQKKKKKNSKLQNTNFSQLKVQLHNQEGACIVNSPVTMRFHNKTQPFSYVKH